MNSKKIKEEKDGEFSYSPSLFFCRKMGTKCGKTGFSKYRISHIIGLMSHFIFYDPCLFSYCIQHLIPVSSNFVMSQFISKRAITFD